MIRKAFIAAVCLFLFAGCAAVSPLSSIGPAVQGYIYWKEGEARKYFKRTPQDVYSAIKLTVLNDLKHEVVSEMRLNGYDMITRSQNHKFHIHVEQTDPMISVCKVRIDFMGDKPYAELLYRSMDKYLGTETIGVIEETNNGEVRERRMFRK